MEATMKRGKIDAISVHEPFATAAIAKGGSRVLGNLGATYCRSF